MEYTIHQLAGLSGVSTRALRWYDKLGLLHPGRRENGYRVYGGAEVDRLQQILFYRTLGVELARIREILDDPSFDALTALRGHLAALEAERERVQGLIDCVRETITAEERKKDMDDKKKFEAFKRRLVEENEEKYGAEVREKYGDAQVDGMYERIRGVSLEQYREWTRLGQEVLDRLSAAVAAGADPKGEEGQEIASLQLRWLNATGNTYDTRRCRALAELYVQDGRFTACYDRETPGCAQFLRDAVLFWIK